MQETKCSCGVPLSQHNTCCGWENANLIVFPWESTIPAYISPEEKELRWILSTTDNGLKIAAKMFSAQPVDYKSLADELVDVLKRYTDFEAMIIKCDRLWWPNIEKDLHSDELYKKMIELQGQRNAAIQKYNQLKSKYETQLCDNNR